MPSFLQKISLEQILYFFVTLIGVILFSYNIDSAALSTDELSAVERSNFNSISDIFKYSISTDSHPPLIQLFIYYWLKIVGYNSFLIKLPFLVMGICSIPLLYKITCKWFNRNAALLTISFFVSIQFTVMYAQIARPYISGLFLSLLLIYQWTKFIENKAKTRNYILYILFGLMLANNHYFGTLQVAVVGLVGLFFIKKEILLKYIITNSLILLLFLPYIPYLFLQMNVEGLTYLQAPGLDYLLKYGFYIFQFSYLAVGLVALILGFSIIQARGLVKNKFTLITLLLFILPILIGFIYSVTNRPVMPYRALIHSFPFMVMFIFSFSQNLKKPILISFCSFILILNCYNLIQKRNHYSIFQKGIAKAGVENTYHIIEKDVAPFVICNLPEFNIKFYQNSHDFSFEYINIHNNDLTPKEFRNQVQEINQTSLVAFNLPENFISIIKEYFPHQKFTDYGFNLNYYLFSKESNPNESQLIYDTTLTFNGKHKSTNFKFKDGEEWGPALSIPIGKIIKNNYCRIESKVSVSNENYINNGLLVFEITDQDKSIVWRSSESKDWLSKSNAWQNMYFSTQLNELVTPKQITNNSILKVYFWNKGKAPLAIDNVSIKINQGNPVIYALFENYPQNTLSSEISK